MGRPFSQEVEHLPESVSWAASLRIDKLKRALMTAAGCNVLVVGSGGSSTAAAFAASLHERRFGEVSRSLTPLEYSVLPTGMRNTFSILLSAEGKNKDILAVASHLAVRGLPGIAVTLTESNPLTLKCVENGSPTPFAFDMPWAKDGYLATNSLIAMMVVIARAYAKDEAHLGQRLLDLDTSWLARRRQFYRRDFKLRDWRSARQVIVLYGERGKVAAIDIESKLAESALGFCQQVDYRQFAHGRHLQLADTNSSPFIVALVSPGDSKLAEATLNLIPEHVDVHQIKLPSDPALAEIVGVLEGMLLTEAIADNYALDPGQPDVPEFGRQIHSLDFSTMVNSFENMLPAFFQRKLPWVRSANGVPDQLRASLTGFLDRLEGAEFKCLVCDFDGTFCDTHLRYDGLDIRLLESVERLLEAGVVIGFATGRGDSLQADLRRADLGKGISPQYWPKVMIGYYSGSEIKTLDEQFEPPARDPRFDDLERWLRATGAIADDVSPKAHGGQFGISCPSVQARNEVLCAVNHWIKSTHATGWRVFASAHSIDVVTEYAGKEKVIDAAAEFVGCSRSEILCIGDSGHFSGNDFELLSAPFSLSVDKVSLVPDVCWNLLPRGKANASGTLYYLSQLEAADGVAKFCPEFFKAVRTDLHSNHGDSK
jgi:fructoselysine-6-P-deglycase FrlB-like protein